jgi:hypothetical protein
MPKPIRYISNVRSGYHADAISGNPLPNPAVASFNNTCEAGKMCGTAIKRFIEWGPTIAVCQDSRKKWLFDVRARFCCLFFARKLADSARILLMMR